jgi:hypothetical protein
MLTKFLLKSLGTKLVAAAVLLVPDHLQAQSEHRVGVQFGMGRSYQIGTPGGSIARPYQRFRAGPSTLVGLWYENAWSNSPWVLRGGLSFAARGYRITQDRFANPWFREARFSLQYGYEFFTFSACGGYRFFDGQRLRIESFGGLALSHGYLFSWYSTSQLKGAYVTPLDYSERYMDASDSTLKTFALVEAVAGLNVRWKSQSRFWNRFSYWLVFHVPTHSYDEVKYSLTETHLNESTTYAGRWRTRMASWTLGVSFDILRPHL